MIESVRLAFADALAYNCDPTAVADGAAAAVAAAADPAAAPAHPLLEELLSKQRAAARRAALFDADRVCLATEDKALGPEREHQGGDTVYCCVVDEEGNACSLINSTYMGFGTGIVPEVSGVEG
jgi:gamma-glutamyltranspeptidase/glutathione hydrolase